MARDAHEGSEVVRGSARNTTIAYATIAVAVKDAPVLIDGDFVEVEQVAVLMATALLPDTAGMLNGIIRSSVHRDPMLPVIIGRGDECVPIAGEANRLVIAGNVGAEETYSGTAGAATYCLYFGSVLDAMRSADIDVTRPANGVGAFVESANGDACMSFQRATGRHRLVVNIGVVDPVVAVDRDGRISSFGLRYSVRYDKLMPGDTAVRTERATLVAGALVNR